MEPTHVLVPMDGSPLAQKAFKHAVAGYDCRITVLNVVTPLDAGMSESGVLETGEHRTERARKRAQDLVGSAQAEVAAERAVETAVEVGDPADRILAFVEDSDVDFVVLGGHGGERGELSRRLLGTVSTTVVSEAPVPVTVVR